MKSATDPRVDGLDFGVQRIGAVSGSSLGSTS